MAMILNLETASTNCSVSVAHNGQLVSLVEENSPNYSHSEQLHLFIDQSIRKAGISFEQLDAVAVSKGPGSYTGLRIGVSAAKGLCYALDIPLISVGTLKSLAHSVSVDKGVIIPMLDARRMEVYAAVFDSDHRELRKTWAEIITPNSFEEYYTGQPVYLVGSGAEKCKEVLTNPNIKFDPSVVPTAKTLANLSFKKYQAKQFENTAYFEPFYLKDFIVTKAK